MKETKHEVFRSGVVNFQKEFAEFLMGNYRKHWKVSKCTFFRDNNNMKSWASCSFEQFV